MVGRGPVVLDDRGTPVHGSGDYVEVAVSGKTTPTGAFVIDQR